VQNPLEARPIEIFQLKIDQFAGVVEFLRAATDVPLRLKSGKSAFDFAEVHAVGTRIGTAIGRIFHAAARNSFLYHFSQIAHLVILFRDATLKA